MSKSKVVIPIEDVNFSNLKFEETKESEYINKNMHMSFANYKHADGTMTTLLMKSPIIDYNLGGLPPVKNQDGEILEDKARAKWRGYISDNKMLEKMSELQEELKKNKSIIIGATNKDLKKFEIQDLIGETILEKGDSINYVNFKFRTKKGNAELLETKFFDKDNNDMEIHTIKDLEAKVRRGEVRYRMIFSLSKVWKLKASLKYGVSFTIEQMQVEERDDVVSKSMKHLFQKSLFDDSVNITTSKLAEVDLKDEEEDAEEEEEKEEEEEEEEEEEIKPSVKKVEVTLKAKPARKKATSSTA
jgi:hypothetical protein